MLTKQNVINIKPLKNKNLRNLLQKRAETFLNITVIHTI